jgi:signal peptide peptidase SppA
MKNQFNQSSITNLSSVVANVQGQKNSKSCFFSSIPIFRSTKPVVAVLNLTGVIGKTSSMKSGLSIQCLNEQIEEAFNMTKLSAVCLIINSPGGSPVQSELISQRIINLSIQKNVPVYSFVEDVAASGGYWLACAGEEIYASKSSILGSIGVISSGFGFHEAIGKLGIERRVYTEGKNKSVLDPFQPSKQSDIKIIKDLQRNIHEHFIDFVKSRRGGRLTQSDEILFNGEFWTGNIALDFGLIDGIEDMYTFIREKFGVDAKIKHIKVKQSWLKQKLGMKVYNKNLRQEIINDFVETISDKISASKYDLF